MKPSGDHLGTIVHIRKSIPKQFQASEACLVDYPEKPPAELHCSVEQNSSDVQPDAVAGRENVENEVGTCEETGTCGSHHVRGSEHLHNVQDGELLHHQDLECFHHTDQDLHVHRAVDEEHMHASVEDIDKHHADEISDNVAYDLVKK